MQAVRRLSSGDSVLTGIIGRVQRLVTKLIRDVGAEEGVGKAGALGPHGWWLLLDTPSCGEPYLQPAAVFPPHSLQKVITCH